MNLQWTSNWNVSAYHTSWSLVHYADRAIRVTDELRGVATELEFLIRDLGQPASRFWDQLFALAATVDYSGVLAERLSTRIGLSSSPRKAHLAALLGNCRRQFERAYPKYAIEMPLRAGVWRQQWDGHGVGLLRRIERLTGEELIVEAAEVVLVQPILGGMGYPHLSTNRIHLEALLTHADPHLPESLRLAWLLSQLDLERPVHSESINTHRLRSVAGLAMLPVVLSAGQELELCCFSTQLVGQAIELWYVDTLHLDAATASAIVTTWWETYENSRPKWKIAIAGLDRMLQ